MPVLLEDKADLQRAMQRRRKLCLRPLNCICEAATGRKYGGKGICEDDAGDCQQGLAYDYPNTAMADGSPSIPIVPQEAGEAAGLLQAYIDALDAAKAADLLESLSAEHVAPLLTQVVGSRLSSHGPTHRAQAEDIASDAMVAFLLHAEAMRTGRASEPILNFDAFVATLGRRACSQYLRRAYPGFFRTGNKVRYLLEKYPDIARWEDGSRDWICGLKEWQGKAPVRVERPGEFHDLVRIKHPADMLAAIFRRAEAPMRFHDLVVLVARLWNVQDEPGDIEDQQHLEQPSTAPDVDMGRREWLAGLWKEIAELNLNQRLALLLNLRADDGSCAASLLVATGVAGMAQIAEALEMQPEDFAALWQRLPMSDLEIAEMLRLTRQQVINLRKCARERLARRMSHISGEGW